MKQLAAILFLLFLAACSNGPNPSEVSASSSKQLQIFLDQQYGAGHATVKDIAVVKTDRSKFDGQATVIIDGSTIKFPMAVSSDGKTTIINPDMNFLNSQIQQISEKRISTLGGAYSDKILEAEFSRYFPPSLTHNLDEFRGRMETIVPVEDVGDYYFGSGGKAHSFGSDEAAWAIEKKTGKLCAVTMVYSEASKFLPEYISFHTFGCSVKNLPAPLMGWAADHQMDISNSSDMDDGEAVRALN